MVTITSSHKGSKTFYTNWRIEYRNCSETALKLLWNRSETALKLKMLRNCSKTALKLLWNCSETALKLPCVKKWGSRGRPSRAQRCRGLAGPTDSGVAISWNTQSRRSVINKRLFTSGKAGSEFAMRQRSTVKSPVGDQLAANQLAIERWGWRCFLTWSECYWHTSGHGNVLN